MCQKDQKYNIITNLNSSRSLEKYAYLKFTQIRSKYKKKTVNNN